MDAAWATLAGRREDVSFAAISAMAAEANITDLLAPDADARLRAAIGHKFPRTARTHFTWEGCDDLPAITTMLGARIVPDSAVTRPLVHTEVPGRTILSAVDIAYALGRYRAGEYLKEELSTYPTLEQGLASARTLAHAKLDRRDLYSLWFAAIRDLGVPAEGVVPSIMQTPAFADLRLGETVAAFGQLRHNNVLLAPQTYEMGGCEIPDSFVEPAPAAYDRLLEYAEQGAELVQKLGGDADDKQYFTRLRKILGVLRTIGRRELENRPLPQEALDYLSMIVEARYGARFVAYTAPLTHLQRPPDPLFNGWYFSLFRDRNAGLATASFLADFYTSVSRNEAVYAGVKGGASRSLRSASLRRRCQSRPSSKARLSGRGFSPCARRARAPSAG